MREECESISVIEFLKEVRHKLWLVLALVMVCMIVGVGMTIATEETKYQATSTIVIGKDSERLFYEDKYTQSDILMYEKIANTYVEIAKSQLIIDKVVERFPKFNSSQIREMVTPESVKDTLILRFHTVGRHPAEVVDISNAYTDIMVEECMKILPVGSLEVLDRAEYPNIPMGSKLVRNSVLGFLFGGFVSMVIVMMQVFHKSKKISTPQQIETYLELEVKGILQ